MYNLKRRNPEYFVLLATKELKDIISPCFMLGSGFMSGPSEQSAASSSHAPASVTGAVTERPGANIVTRGTQHNV